MCRGRAALACRRYGDVMADVDGMVVVVSGAEGAIGRAVAGAMARAGGTVRGIEGDPKSRTACAEAIERAVAAAGGLDVLVNCLDVETCADSGDVVALYERGVHQPLRGLYFLSQAAHGVMRTRGGRIVNVGPLGAREAHAMPAMAAVRTALEQLTKTMAVEWAGENILVNCVIPGSADRAEDVAAFVVALASAAAAHVSGQTVRVDGGASVGGSWDRT